MFTRELTAAPDYDAMSYTWDGQDLDEDVLFGGRVLKTALNVKRMLQQRASCLRTTYLWIDAVCINQTDESEKSSQILLMGKIYSQAKRTLVWLNSTNPKPSEAIRIKITLHFIGLLAKYLTNDIELLDLGCYHLSSQELWGCVEKFLAHPYWGRLWIIQEVSMGREVNIIYGGQFTNWNYLVKSLEPTFFSPHFTKNIAKRMDDRRQPAEMISVIQNKIFHIDEARKLLSRKMSTLSLALQISARSKASLAVDKIFGLRGLAVDDSDYTPLLAWALKPDYGISYTQVFIRAAV